jgi:hypothetical protein
MFAVRWQPIYFRYVAEQRQVCIGVDAAQVMPQAVEAVVAAQPVHRVGVDGEGDGPDEIEDQLGQTNAKDGHHREVGTTKRGVKAGLQ